MGKIVSKGYQFSDYPNPTEYNIKVNKPISKKFVLLRYWSLKDLRKMYMKHWKNDFPIFVSKFQFRELFAMDKNNSDYLFNFLSNPTKSKPAFDVPSSFSQTALNFGGFVKPAKKERSNKICMYELLAVMAVMSYANYYNKIRFIFNLFDFDAIMVVCFLEGWGKVIEQEMPPRRNLETFAELIYSAAEFVPNGKITIKGIGDWIDGNDNLMSLLQAYEPPDKIEDENSIFLPLPRNANHLQILSNIYLGKQTLITQEQDNDDYNYGSTTKKAKEKTSKNKDFSELVKLKRNKKIKIPSFKLDDTTNEHIQNMRKSSSVPALESIEDQTQKLPWIDERHGKTYKRKDILAIKNYFDSIDTKNKGYITIDDYVKSASKSSHLKRIAVSLFTYLDSSKSGKVNFETMLAKITPGANKDNIKYMLGWIKEEEKIMERAVINYKMPQYMKKAPKLNQKLGFKHLRDFLHIFVDLDRNHDGYLCYEDLYSRFQHILTKKDINSYFTEFGKTPNDLLSLEEFLKIMLPKDCIVPEELIESECKSYVSVLTSIARKEDDKVKVTK